MSPEVLGELDQVAAPVLDSGVAHRAGRLGQGLECVPEGRDPGVLGVDVVDPKHRGGDTVFSEGRLPCLSGLNEGAVPHRFEEEFRAVRRERRDDGEPSGFTHLHVVFHLKAKHIRVKVMRLRLVVHHDVGEHDLDRHAVLPRCAATHASVDASGMERVTVVARRVGGLAVCVRPARLVAVKPSGIGLEQLVDHGADHVDRRTR